MVCGTAHITSNNSWDHPEVECTYFGHPLDLVLQREAVKGSCVVYQTEPLASMVTEEIMPGIAVRQSATDAEGECWMRELFTGVWHYFATLAMMEEELGGVVDSRLRIHGLEKLRAVMRVYC